MTVKKDKDGPQIDIANDIIANLKNRLIMVTDNVLPVTKQSERVLIAVSLKNVDIVKAAVDKAMKNDPNAIECFYQAPRHLGVKHSAGTENGTDIAKGF